MDFPRPPPSMDGKVNDLMRRVGEFLPKIEQANQDLDGSEVQLDTTLVEDKDSGEDENDGNDESDTEENEPVGGAPTIELKVALGSLDENPGIALLADASDNEKETEKNSKDCNAADGKPAARLKLALDALKPQETNQSTTTKKRKQAPIEELS